MTIQVTRTFVAARAFLQGLQTSREVVGKVLQVKLPALKSIDPTLNSPVFHILEEYFYCFWEKSISICFFYNAVFHLQKFVLSVLKCMCAYLFSDAAYS